MLNTRRTTLLHLLGLSAASLARPENHSVQGSPVVMDLPAPPKEIKVKIHGREFRLKYSSLKSQQQAALYCHLWYLHLTYGLVIDQEFVADDNGMLLRFQSGTDPERQYRVTPFIKKIAITEDSQAGVALLASCILAAVTRGDGFSERPRSPFGEGMFRNWFAHPGSATSKDEKISAVCGRVLQRWRKDPSSNINDQQISELAGADTFEPTYRKQRIQGILDWLLSLRPAARDTVSAVALQAFMDFVRWQTSWMEQFSPLADRLEKRRVASLWEARDSCRWMAMAIAYKCLLGTQPLPSIRLAFSADKETPLSVVLGGVNNSFLRFPVTSFGAEKANATAVAIGENNSKKILGLQADIFPQLTNLLDYPLYAIVASLGLSRASRDRKKFLETTESVIGTRMEEIVPPGSIVLGSVDPTSTEVRVSEPDWHWFREWKQLRI